MKSRKHKVKFILLLLACILGAGVLIWYFIEDRNPWYLVVLLPAILIAWMAFKESKRTHF